MAKGERTANTQVKRAAAPDCETPLLLRKVEVEATGRGPVLALVLAADLGAPIGPLDRAVEPQERELPDRHAVVDVDRQVRDVGELEREVAGKAGVDEAGRGVDQQPDPAERALALQAGHQVVRQLDALERLREDELARVEDERLARGDLEGLGDVLQRLADVDERVADVVEDAEVPVEADVDARGLDQRGIVRLEHDAAGRDLLPDRRVAQDHGVNGTNPHGGSPARSSAHAFVCQASPYGSTKGATQPLRLSVLPSGALGPIR